MINEEVNMEMIEFAMKESIDESLWDSINFSKIIGEGELVWDGTAYEVKSPNQFYMIISTETYEVVDMFANDINIVTNVLEPEEVE